MNKITGNAPCPCGSGKKYKNCCSTKRPSVPEGLPPGVARDKLNAPRPKGLPALEGLPYGIRMKGGIRSNPTGDGFVALVHIWDNIECRGEPDEWCSTEVFATEEEALQYYKTSIRPALEQMIKAANDKSGIKAIFRKLEP